MWSPYSGLNLPCLSTVRPWHSLSVVPRSRPSTSQRASFLQHFQRCTQLSTLHICLFLVPFLLLTGSHCGAHRNGLPPLKLEEGHCERARHMNMPCPRHMFSLSPPGMCVRALRNLTLPHYLSRPHAQGPSWKTDSRQGRLRNSHLAASSHRVLTRQGYRYFIHHVHRGHHLWRRERDSLEVSFGA